MTSQSAERIGGWLLAPLAWLLVALLSASLSLLFFANALMSPLTYTLLRAMSAGHMALWVASLLFALAMWYYTLWLLSPFSSGARWCRNTTLSGCSSPCCWR
ncbi:hypothetical protein NUBL13938_14450 [Klebsiella pneumoniae]|nr:hypothetical protein NUBL13937_09570 [Klebsiella pneumoniae]GKM25376.1 hypothetical protein NUBL13938_14450 [Klebsiella pneumoniae]